MVAWEKKHKNVSFYGVCMYVRPKLTFVSFFYVLFFCTLPLSIFKKNATVYSARVKIWKGAVLHPPLGKSLKGEKHPLALAIAIVSWIQGDSQY